MTTVSDIPIAAKRSDTVTDCCLFFSGRCKFTKYTQRQADVSQLCT